jgi:hypothetical protein
MNAHEIVATASRILVDTQRVETPWINVNEAARRAVRGQTAVSRDSRRPTSSGPSRRPTRAPLAAAVGGRMATSRVNDSMTAKHAERA